VNIEGLEIEFKYKDGSLWHPSIIKDANSGGNFVSASI
jgi:hypothetical protein